MVLKVIHFSSDEGEAGAAEVCRHTCTVHTHPAAGHHTAYRALKLKLFNLATEPLNINFFLFRVPTWTQINNDQQDFRFRGFPLEIVKFSKSSDIGL